MLLQGQLDYSEMNMDASEGIMGRAEKMRRTEWTERRDAAVTPLSHQMSTKSIGEDVGEQRRAVSESSRSNSEEEGSHHVSESSSGGDVDSDEFSEDSLSDDDFSDDESTEGVASFDDWSVNSIVVDWVDESTSGEEAGRFVGGNARLKKLAIRGESMEWNAGSTALEWFEGLCAGVARNRSIAHLSFRECSLANEALTTTIATLGPFLEFNANLCRLDIVGCSIRDETTRMLASALSRRDDKSSLRRIILDANNIGDDSGHDLVDAMRGYENLEELSLGDNEIGQRSCVALSGLLSSPNTKLKDLNIENNQIDNDCIAHLTNALTINCVLSELNLSFNCGITQAGWKTFAACLQSPNSALEVLDVSSTNIADEGAIALGRGLANNKALKDLRCYDICAHGTPLITAAGWRSVFACLRNEESALERLDLRYSSIDEGGLSALTNALSSNSSLRMLDVGHNERVSAEGWRSFFACLERPRSALEEVRLRGNRPANEDAARLARSLRANNGRLRTLDLGDRPSVADAGWAELSDALCDASSVAAIRSSNHALRSLGSPDVPRHLDELLLLNSRGDEGGVAREKILRYHYKNGKANMQEFANMELNVLPRAASWAGRDVSGRTLLYELVRSLPQLVASANVKKVAGGKRGCCYITNRMR